MIDLIEAFRQERLEFVLTRHEAAAAFMAEAIGSSTGVPGVCLATLGPGATNLVTGVAHAYLDRAPVLAFSAQLPAERYPRVTHQKLDLAALFAPITKWQARITAASVGPVMERALALAVRHRPGPVFLEVPSDVPRQEAQPWAGDAPAVAAVADAVDPRAAAAAAALLRASVRPLILAGMEALRDDVGEPLRQLAERWRVPVMVSPKAKGIVREDHPLFLGTIEALGTGALYDYIDGCDLVLMIGFDPVEFDRDWTAPAKVVHIGPLPNADRYYPSAVELVGPVASAIAALLAVAGPPTPKRDLDEVRGERERFVAHVHPPCAGLAAQTVLAELRRALPEDALVTCDVGNNKAVAAQCWAAYSPKTFFVSNGLSSMGYGLPAALGLKLVAPERAVACVVGDGGFAMVMGELETAVRRDLAVLVVVLVDDALSQIKAGQERRGLRAIGTTFAPVDHLALARAFGVAAWEARNAAECRGAFVRALAARGPALVAARVDPSCYRL